MAAAAAVTFNTEGGAAAALDKLGELIAEADPFESEPESDEEDIVASGIHTAEFVASTGVRVYTAACERLGVVPVQQFIVMMDRESVSLKHRGLGTAGGRALFECVRVNRCITMLDLEDNQLGLGVDPDAGGLDHISSALAENRLLTILDLSYNSLSARGCASISRALSGSNLTELSLRGNAIGDVGALALADALLANRSIAKLDLSDNLIGEAGAGALASLLSKCAHLRTADFSWNAIRLGGALALAAALKDSKVVRLSLAWNGFGDRGGKAIAEALAANRQLLSLDISKNNLREEAAAALAAALALNSTLRSLQLHGNPLSDRGVGQLLQAVAVHRSVRDLGLQAVPLERSGVGLYDPLNPTGRFLLDLADKYDRSVAESHLELARQEAVSGAGGLLNVAHGGKPLNLAEGADIRSWPLPAAGTLAYDFVSAKRVPPDTRAEEDERFAPFQRELASSQRSDSERLLALRIACMTHYFSCAQARELLLAFSYMQRADAVVVLFRRCVDLGERGDSIWALLAPAERTALRERLGEALLPYLPAESRPI